MILSINDEENQATAKKSHLFYSNFLAYPVFLYTNCEDFWRDFEIKNMYIIMRFNDEKNQGTTTTKVMFSIATLKRNSP